MKSLFPIALCLLTLVSLSQAADPNSPAPELPRVVLIGDSIRMNYQAAATKALAGKAEVYSPKENCRHTLTVLSSVERWLEEAGGDASVIHLNAGLHDIYLNAKTDKPTRDLESYAKNLRAIFAKIDELSDATVIFALTTAVNEADQASSKGYQRVVRRNSDVDTYNAKAREIAQELGIEVNDLNAFMKAKGTEKILRPSDGIHLSPEGSELLGGEVARVIVEHLGKAQ